MKLLFVVLAIIVHALADVNQSKYHRKEQQSKKEEFYSKQHSYHGRYDGKCNKDGFYYKDAESFVICSNNNAYVQPCAPGSINSGYENYKYGATYYYRDFCDVNLVDHGYGVNHYGDNDVHKDVGYVGPKHEASYNEHYAFHGKYRGQCEKDGFYYGDDDSFVMCSNNNAYVQPCAPGTRNSGYNNFHQGSAYYYHDFCDVNLVDHGYGVHYGGYAKNQNEYNHPYTDKKQEERRESQAFKSGYGSAQYV